MDAGRGIASISDRCASRTVTRRPVRRASFCAIPMAVASSAASSTMKLPRPAIGSRLDRWMTIGQVARLTGAPAGPANPAIR